MSDPEAYREIYAILDQIGPVEALKRLKAGAPPAQPLLSIATPEKPQEDEADRTARFLEAVWKEGPPQTRLRSSKKQLRDAWTRTKKKPEMREVIRVLRLWAKCEAWTKDDGQFAQAIHRWVQNRQWENIPEAPEANPQKPTRCL